MLGWIGIVCVAWTAFELGRMACTRREPRSAPRRPRADVPTPRAGGRRDARRERRNPTPRWRAWDEAGRRIVVEDRGFV